MEDIFSSCREGHIAYVRDWLDRTENDPNEGDEHCFTPLHWSCRQGRPGIVDMLLPRGTKVNTVNMGDDTPLHMAASHGHLDIVEKLLKYKVDVNAINAHGNTPLHYACFWGYEAVGQSLINNGALVSLCNAYGQTPLDMAKPATAHLFEETATANGQEMNRIEYRDPNWLGTTKTRPRDQTLSKVKGISLSQLQLQRKLNENQSGETVEGVWQGIPIVAKFLKVRNMSKRSLQDFDMEYPRLRIFSHPNVHPLLCVVHKLPELVVVSEKLANGSLYNILHEPTNLVVDHSQAIKFALDIAKGMAFLHRLEPMIPRLYLCSRHVMIDEELTAKINMTDYKFTFQNVGKSYCPAWLAPEALQKSPTEINMKAADIWSYAILLWELVTRDVPFAGFTNMEIGMKIATENLRVETPPGGSPHLCKLMKICMHEDPTKRPRFDQIVPILNKMKTSVDSEK